MAISRKPVPPPPTKFGTAGLQTKLAETTISGAILPPATQFGAPAGVMQSKAAPPAIPAPPPMRFGTAPARAEATTGGRLQPLHNLFYSGPRRGNRDRPETALPSARAIQRMTVRGTFVASTISPATSAKHVQANADERQRVADAAFGDHTFVASSSDLTGPIDMAHQNFAEATRTKSSRLVVHAEVKVFQYNKRATEEGVIELGKASPADLTNNGTARRCEIGAYKNGQDLIIIDHFKVL